MVDIFDSAQAKCVRALIPYKKPTTRHSITFTSSYTPTQRVHLNASPPMDDHRFYLSRVVVEESWHPDAKHLFDFTALIINA